MNRQSFIGYLERFGLNFLVKGGFLMAATNVLGGALGYFYQVLMGRLLDPPEFSVFAAIMGLAMFFGAPISAMQLVVSRSVTRAMAVGQMITNCDFYKFLHKYIFICSLIFLPVVFFIAPQFQALIKSSSLNQIYLLGFILVTAIFLAINTAFFQGQKQFYALSLSNTINILLKIIFGGFLVLSGLGVSGALAGAALAMAIVWLVGAIYNVKVLSRSYDSPEPKAEFKDENIIIPVLVASIAFVAMTQLDVVLVNYFFEPEESGIFAAVSVLGKAVLYLPGGFIYVFFPMVAETHAANRTATNLLKEVASLTVLSCGCVVAIYFLFGSFIVESFYGSAYEGRGGLLGWYGLSMIPIAVVLIAEYFLIAKGRVLFAWLFILVAPLQILAVITWHSELWMVILAQAISGSTILLVGLSFLIYEKSKSKTGFVS